MAQSLNDRLADAYVRYELHEHSALSSIYERDIAVENALRVGQRAWKLAPANTRPTFDIFAGASYRRIRDVTSEPHCRLPDGCTALLTDLSIKYFDAPLNYVDGLKQYIVDAPVPPEYRAIPSTLFAPYLPHSPQRYLAIRDRISPIPIWFFERGPYGVSLGVPVGRARTGHMQLLHGDYKLDVLKDKKSFKLKFNWPNYVVKPDKQIRGTPNSPMHPLDRLAQLTASTVCNFMEAAEAYRIDGAPPRWSDIGTGPGEVSVGNTILLGIIFVSDGAAMPLLATRELA